MGTSVVMLKEHGSKLKATKDKCELAQLRIGSIIV